MSNVIVMNRKANTFLKGGIERAQMVSEFTQAHAIFIPKRATIRNVMMQMIADALGVERSDLEILDMK